MAAACLSIVLLSVIHRNDEALCRINYLFGLRNLHCFHFKICRDVQPHNQHLLRLAHITYQGADMFLMRFHIIKVRFHLNSPRYIAGNALLQYPSGVKLGNVAT